MFNGLSTVLRLISRVACLIVIASFALFATDQAGSASAKQQNAVNSAAPAGAATATLPTSTKHSESSARRTLDDASEALTSPFSGVTSASSNEWVVRGGNMVLALLLYGFGLGFLARVLRVRV
jgi:hypothetical protein